MSFALKTLIKPFRQLRKSLKTGLGQPSPEEVHDIRMHSRRFEATMHALALDREPEELGLAKTIAHIRKRAGKVRDMDVFAAFTSALTCEGESDCIAELTAYLGGKRSRFAGRLADSASKRQKKALRELKRFSDRISRRFSTPETRGREIREWRSSAVAASQTLLSDLAAWPSLEKNNLHRFRIKVKELINILQLRDEPDGELLDALEEAKNAIGEWHDWSELKKIAAKVIQHGRNCGLRTTIDLIVKQKLERALFVSARLRRIYVRSKMSEGWHASARKPAIRVPAKAPGSDFRLIQKRGA